LAQIVGAATATAVMGWLLALPAPGSAAD